MRIHTRIPIALKSFHEYRVHRSGISVSLSLGDDPCAQIAEDHINIARTSSRDMVPGHPHYKALEFLAQPECQICDAATRSELAASLRRNIQGIGAGASVATASAEGADGGQEDEEEEVVDSPPPQRKPGDTRPGVNTSDRLNAAKLRAELEGKLDLRY